MQQQLATRLSLADTTREEEVSQPVSMAGANCAQLEVTIFAIAGTVTFTLQYSNDLQNWTDDTGTAPTKNDVGTEAFDAVTGIGCAYVRVKYSLTSAANDHCILAANLNTSAQ